MPGRTRSLLVAVFGVVTFVACTQEGAPPGGQANDAGGLPNDAGGLANDAGGQAGDASGQDEYDAWGCPAQRPASHSACAPVGLKCQYTPKYGCQLPSDAECRADGWLLSSPAVLCSCPEVLPVSGSECDPGHGTLPCVVLDESCGEDATARCDSATEKWIVDTPCNSTGAGGSGGSGDAAVGPSCGNKLCAGSEFCLISCGNSMSTNPFHCSALPEGGTCPVEHPKMSMCIGGLDAGAEDGGTGLTSGCSLATFSYECKPLAANQTTVDCSQYGWTTVTIYDGSASCCHD
ncbi:MAG: hypothetical protein HY898_24710 [Deltaproteobacteria bacterium]|nr:hypothetical protein [Deltaproteobacteria bacterium]